MAYKPKTASDLRVESVLAAMRGVAKESKTYDIEDAVTACARLRRELLKCQKGDLKMGLPTCPAFGQREVNLYQAYLRRLHPDETRAWPEDSASNLENFGKRASPAVLSQAQAAFMPRRGGRGGKR